AGNAVLWARPSAAARDLVSRPLRFSVELVSRTVARVDDGYFRLFVDFASSGAVEAEDLVPAADAADRGGLPAARAVLRHGLWRRAAVLLHAELPADRGLRVRRAVVLRRQERRRLRAALRPRRGDFQQMLLLDGNGGRTPL
ncbi:unnamed protein product, partial [Urochloa humidicola]